MAWPSSWVTPSKVRAYIEAALGAAPPVPPNDLGAWHSESSSRASAILAATEGVEQRILVESLTDEEGFQWLQAVSQLRLAVSAWQAGRERFPLARVGTLPAHPALVAYRLLEKCPDEIIPAAEPRLTFITDAKLKTSIARDVDSLSGMVRSDEWKAATVIGGSIVEALLLDRLMDRANQAGAQAVEAAHITNRDRGWSQAPLADWKLWS